MLIGYGKETSFKGFPSPKNLEIRELLGSTFDIGPTDLILLAKNDLWENVKGKKGQQTGANGNDDSSMVVEENVPDQ